MITQFAVFAFWNLAILAFVQALMATSYLRALNRGTRRLKPDMSCPKVAVVLCARGPDPFLADTVEALLAQDYPDFDIRIVVDSREDPAWEIVEDVVQRSDKSNVRILPLTNRRRTCSLKIASVLQGMDTLDDSHEAIVMLDSDTVPHAQWLCELIAPLEDGQVGAASGNRWYMPSDCTWGSLVRFAWNVAAVVPMYLYRIAWGGSMSVSMKAFRGTDLRDRLAEAFGEDSTICRSLIRQKLRISFVPSAMMVNRETCSIRGFYRFLIRQLLTVRLHNPWWWAVVAHCLLTATGQLLALAGLIAGMSAGNWAAMAWTGSGLVMYLSAMVLLLSAMEIFVRRIVRARGEAANWISPLTGVRLVLAIPLTQAVYTVGLIHTMFARTHRWRGIVYRFGGNPRVYVTEDLPFKEAAPEVASTTSL